MPLAGLERRRRSSRTAARSRPACRPAARRRSAGGGGGGAGVGTGVGAGVAVGVGDGLGEARRSRRRRRRRRRRRHVGGLRGGRRPASSRTQRPGAAEPVDSSRWRPPRHERRGHARRADREERTGGARRARPAMPRHAGSGARTSRVETRPSIDAGAAGPQAAVAGRDARGSARSARAASVRQSCACSVPVERLPAGPRRGSGGRRRRRRPPTARSPAARAAGRRDPRSEDSNSPAGETGGADEMKYPGDDLFSQEVAPRVSSALESLTSVFGMGTGGASPLASPG